MLKSSKFPLFLCCLICVIQGCSSNYRTLEGETMGTYYRITIHESGESISQTSLDSLLAVFNQSLSTYIPDSEISRFNTNALLRPRLPYFMPVLKLSKDIYKKTNGAFDPTVMPLVRIWGFGPDGPQFPDSAAVDSLRQYVSFDSIFFDNEAVCKLKKGIQLDFSAIAKGYGVDVVSAFLQLKGADAGFVEIGGEVKTWGKNTKGEAWRVGIENPAEALTDREATAGLVVDNAAIATSGNYRNFYEKNGQKYAHTINPKTGYPVQHSLLSASVIAPDCATADAYATAFMVLGVEKAMEIVERDPELEGFFIYDDQGEVKIQKSKGVNQIF